ncbi:unnamed protein product [Rhizophagus irregularis]|nr:unnamed protein product [Rhizophagus irregularis]
MPGWPTLRFLLGPHDQQSPRHCEVFHTKEKRKVSIIFSSDDLELAASRLTFSTSCLVFFGNSIYSSSLASSYLALNSTFSAISLEFSFLINNKVSNS